MKIKSTDIMGGALLRNYGSQKCTKEAKKCNQISSFKNCFILKYMHKMHKS